MFNIHTADKLQTPCSKKEQFQDARDQHIPANCKQTGTLYSRLDRTGHDPGCSGSPKNWERPAHSKGVLDHLVDFALVFAASTAVTQFLPM